MKQRSSILFLVSSLLSLLRGVTAEGAVELTKSNIDELVNGKNVFIKFYAPWCAHCRAMSDDWAKLAKDYADHPVAFIGQVDCTSDEGSPVCEDFDVGGFPTLVYGDPMSVETYDGGRDYDSMAAWAKEHITKPICSVYRLDNCGPKDTKIIEDLQAMTDKELEAIVVNVEAKVKSREVDFDERVTTIQKEYDLLVEQFNKDLEVIKGQFNYKYVEQLLAMRTEESDDGASEEQEESEL